MTRSLARCRFTGDVWHTTEVMRVACDRFPADSSGDFIANRFYKRRLLIALLDEFHDHARLDEAERCAAARALYYMGGAP